MSDVLEMARPPGTAVMHGNVQRTWSPADPGPQLEIPTVDPAFVRHQNWNPPYESDHVLPLPGPTPRAQLEYLNQVAEWIGWESCFHYS